MDGSPGIATPLARWERLLLEAELGSAARDRTVDAVLFAYAVLAATATTVNDHHAGIGPALLVLDAALAVPACLALWLRRARPVAVGWTMVALSALSSAAVHAGLVGVFSAAVHARPRRALEIAGAAIVALAVNRALYAGARGHGAFDWGFFWLWTATTAAALAFGSFVRVRRLLVVSLHERADRLRDEQRLRVSEARLAERARIAREMHDVLAHRISLLNVHAGALEVNPGAAPEAIARSAEVIRMSARAAHDELREVIGVLRDPDAAGVREPPQPTLDDVATLIDESRHAGMDVGVEDRLAAAPLPATTGRTVYRVVQEALTNARKHGAGQPVVVRLSGAPGVGLAVEVVNRPAGAGGGAVPAAVAAADGTGTGLVGVAERVALLGGTLEHAPLAGGGFRLRARLPWPEAAT